jgi:hypothetical protein
VIKLLFYTFGHLNSLKKLHELFPMVTSLTEIKDACKLYFIFVANFAYFYRFKRIVVSLKLNAIDLVNFNTLVRLDENIIVIN